MKEDRERVKRDRKIIMEMIDASWVLAEKKVLTPWNIAGS